MGRPITIAVTVMTIVVAITVVVPVTMIEIPVVDERAMAVIGGVVRIRGVALFTVVVAATRIIALSRIGTVRSAIPAAHTARQSESRNCCDAR